MSYWQAPFKLAATRRPCLWSWLMVLQSKLQKLIYCQSCLIFSCIIVKDVLKLAKALIAELAMVEEEILWLERKIDELKMKLYKEKKRTKEWKMQQSEFDLDLPTEEVMLLASLVLVFTLLYFVISS
ncbi:hypothetical protein PTKIN_Ptkin10aG0078900 [Pterospermum kingtungense]